MPYKIDLLRNVRFSRGMHTPGVYRVPADIREADAERYVASGAAVKIENPVKPVVVAEVEEVEKSTVRFRKRAPRDKSRGRAPENKSRLDDMRSGSDGTEPDA